MSALSKIMFAMFNMQNEINNTQATDAQLTKELSDIYNDNLKIEQKNMNYWAQQTQDHADDKDVQYYEQKFTEASQNAQNWNGISQNMLSGMEDSVSRLGESVSQIGNMFKGLMQNFQDYVNSLIAQSF